MRAVRHRRGARFANILASSMGEREEFWAELRKRDGEERERERERKEFEIFCKSLNENTRGAKVVLRVKLYFQFLVSCQRVEWLD